ncbi:MAG TPA: GNAT family N-acyltransferase [Alphaproteobacteria bacterium]
MTAVLQNDRPLPALRTGNLELRLAETPAEIDAALALRYRVFYEEMAAKPTGETARAKRDVDAYDAYCDHLLVLDHSQGSPVVVGTYRLIRRAAAAKVGGFYSASEYDVSKLVALPGEILELGRSCVDAAHRNRPTMQLMWRGISNYVFHHDIQVMFGCASLPGTDVRDQADILSYLHHFHLAPPALRTRALPSRYVDMALKPADALNARACLADLPPLVKGYLRLGGFVGDGAVIDEQFNTIDVCVIVKTELVTEKYMRHYESQRDTPPA